MLYMVYMLRGKYYLKIFDVRVLAPVLPSKWKIASSLLTDLRFANSSTFALKAFKLVETKFVFSEYILKIHATYS